MLPKHKYTPSLTALIICGVALTTLAFNSGQIQRLMSGKNSEVAKSAAPVKGELKSAVASASPVTAMMVQGPGIAPTGDPGQGFDIEGNLQANTPNANTSDWVPGLAGTGVGALTAAGAPVDPAKTFHPIDLYNNGADNIFKGGNKINENPNTQWSWVTQKAPAKDDINNGLLHISTDSSGDLWFVVSGDRLSNNGDSYIDFEFLQNTLTANANGTFTSAGPNGGRTVGDLLVTIELVNGGAVPEFFVQRWQAVGSGFDWVDITPPDGTAFVAANRNFTTVVPYGAFGSTTYLENSFAEAAININDLISTLNPCIGIKTALIKTKTSQSPTATLKDFIDPLQLNIGTAPVANAGPDLAACQAAQGTTNFTLNGVATNGTPQWSYGSGTIPSGSVTIVSPNSATTNVQIANGQTGTVTLRLRVTSAQCGFVDDFVTMMVNPAAVASAGNDQTACRAASGPTVFTLNGMVSAGAATPLWSVIGSTGSAAATIVSPNSATTNVNVTGAGTLTLRLTSSVFCGTATDDVVLTVNPNPTADAGPDQAKCGTAASDTFTLAGVATNGTPTWSVVGATGGASAMIANPGSLASNVTFTGFGTVTLALTVVSANCGTAVDEVVLTRNEAAVAMAGGDQAKCQDASGTTSFTVTGVVTAGSATPLWSVLGTTGTAAATIVSPNNATTNINVTGVGAVTLRLTSATVSCGAATDDVVLTVNPNPSATITAPDAVCALSTGNAASVPNAGQGATYLWTITNGTITSGQGMPSITWTAGSTNPVTLNVQVMTAAGCQATGSKQVTVNALPSAAAGPDQAKCQDASGTTSFTVNGVVTGSAPPLWSVFGTTGTAAATIVSPNNLTTQVNVTGAGAVTLRLRSATANCDTATDDVVLTVSPNPGAIITAPSTVCALSTGNTASVPNAGQGASYLWTITDGTITSGQGTPSITWTAGSAGSTTLSVTVSVGAGCSASGSKSVTVNTCNTDNKGPGAPYPDTSEVSDQKAGSVLIYNFYTSSASGADQDTRINITNISQNMPVAIHLFFVDGATCSVADSFLCLTQNQTASFQASDLDPGTSGYLVAVAVDIDTGCPISFNCLIGDEYVKLSSGHAANLGAEAFSALYTGTLPGCDQNSETADLVFNGTTGYNRVPRSLALSNIPSLADNNNTLLILNRIGGDLRSAASSLTSIFGILYNDLETPLSFSFNPGACQFRASLTNNFPRTAPRIETFIPSGRSGWMRLSMSGSDGNRGILGAEINFNPGAGAGAFNQGHNLHKLTFDTINTYTIPIIPPPC